MCSSSVFGKPSSLPNLRLSKLQVPRLCPIFRQLCVVEGVMTFNDLDPTAQRFINAVLSGPELNIGQTTGHRAESETTCDWETI